MKWIPNIMCIARLIYHFSLVVLLAILIRPPSAFQTSKKNELHIKCTQCKVYFKLLQLRKVITNYTLTHSHNYMHTNWNWLFESHCSSNANRQSTLTFECTVNGLMIGTRSFRLYHQRHGNTYTHLHLNVARVGAISFEAVKISSRRAWIEIFISRAFPFLFELV